MKHGWLPPSCTVKHPDAEDFSLDEIRDRARREFHDNRPGVWQHIVSHCVASNRPNPAQYRMLARRRARPPAALPSRRPGSSRAHRKGKIYPEKRDIPERYQDLVDWYLRDYVQKRNRRPKGASPAVLLQFVGLIPAYDLKKMQQAIEEDCERIDASEW